MDSIYCPSPSFTSLSSSSAKKKGNTTSSPSIHATAVRQTETPSLIDELPEGIVHGDAKRHVDALRKNDTRADRDIFTKIPAMFPQDQ